MIKEAIGTGNTVDEAKAAAMVELGISDFDDFTVEVVQTPTKKILGLFGGNPAKVKVSVTLPDPKPEKYTKVLGTAVLGDNVEVKGYIAAVSAQGPILNDDGGSILLYKTSGVEVGDEVTVSGTISSYNYGFQIFIY